MPLSRAAVLLCLALAAPGSAARPPALLAKPAATALLPAAEAFALLPVERRGDRLHLEWNIAPGYYLYRHRLQIRVVAPGGLTLGALQLPAGVAHHDEHFGDVEIYRGLLAADVAVGGAWREPVTLRVSFQGCADVGVCYPPQTLDVGVQTP